MIYRAVGNRIAVDPCSLKLGIAKEVILDKLIQIGFTLLTVDPVAIAKSQIGIAKYQRGAKPTQAPDIMDCTTFTKWIYGQCGIWLPRYSLQQREFGARIDLQDILAGDIVFTTGHHNYYDTDPNDNVGHAGLATGEKTVIHAANSRTGVVESPLLKFIKNRDNFRGAVRLLPKDREIWCLAVPPEIWIETSDDLRFLLLQRL